MNMVLKNKETLADDLRIPLMIPGASDEEGKLLEVASPFDNQHIANVATANAAGVERALNNASDLFAGRSQWLPVDQRIKILERMTGLLGEHAEELAAGASLEGGKPLIDSRIEMARCIDSFRICIQTLRTDAVQPPVMGVNAASKHRIAFTRREPVGVVVAFSAFNHAGQVCVSAQRIFAHASIARKLADKMADRAGSLIVGDPLSEQTEVGPLIRPQESERVDQWVHEAVAGGPELLCGGEALDHHCYAPTVLFDPPRDARISTQEVFGPVVCVYPFTELDTAIKAANELDVAFQASVYSRDVDTALYISELLAASAVMINDHTAFRVDWMPFAGLKHSGLGVGGIPFTMRDMQIEKMTVIHSGSIA